MRVGGVAVRLRWVGNLLTAVAMVSIPACGGGSSTTAPPATGAVTVSVTQHGNGNDADGFTVTVRGQSVPLQLGTPVTVSSIPLGDYTLVLSGLGAGCSADADSILQHVAGGDTAAVQFAVGCYGAIAYGVGVSSNETQIHYLDENGHDVQVTSGVSRNLMLDFSPDGSHILFASDRNGTSDLFAVGIDGTGLVQLTSGTGEDIAARWSPDGNKIALFREAAGGGTPFSVHVVDANGTNETLLLDGTHLDFDPSWTPDGLKILFACDRFGSSTWELCSMTPSGTGLAQIGSFTGVQIPVADPTGAYIAFESYVAGQSIWVTPMDGSSAVNLTPGTVSFTFDWAPDGAKLALSTTDGTSFFVERVNRDGTGLTPLTTAADAAGEPWWSPDGGHIAFDAVRGGTQQIWVMDPNGGDWHRISALGGGSKFRPIWSPVAHATAVVARARSR